ncbi:MAG: TolC family protein, partial [Proteobacteria bacterium]
RLADRAGQAELDWTKFQTDRQIVLAFYQALSWKELREVAEQNVSTLKEHLDDAQLLKRTGVSTNYDVLRVEVQMSEAQTELLNAQDEEVLSLKRLLETLGRSPEEATTLTGQLPVVELPEAATTGLDSSKRSDLIAQGYRVSASGEEANAASKHWFPKLGLFGQYQHYNNLGDKAFQTSGQFRDAYNLGVQVTWNLFDGLSANAKAHQSAEQKIQNEKTLEMARLRAANDLENWRRKFRYFSQVFKARSNDVNKATESVRLARVGRKAGVRTTSEQLDAELELFRARAGVVRSQVGMIEALVNLERSSGVRLYSFN